MEYTSDLLIVEGEIRPVASTSARPSSSPSNKPTATSAPSNPGSGSATASSPSSGASAGSTAPDGSSSSSPAASDGGEPTPSADPDGGPGPDPTEPPATSSAPAATSMTVPSAAPADPALIADFEDGTTKLLRREGRNGYWFTSAAEDDPVDGTITAAGAGMFAAPTPDGDGNDSKKAVHVIAQGYDTGTAHAEFGGNFLADEGAYAPTADWLGISFLAKIGADDFDDDNDGSQFIRFELPLTSTAASYDHYGRELLITDEWVRYYVQWADADFAQTGFGDAVTFEPGLATGMQLKMVADRGDTGFDLWVDDIRFIAPPDAAADAGAP